MKADKQKCTAETWLNVFVRVIVVCVKVPPENRENERISNNFLKLNKFPLAIIQ